MKHTLIIIASLFLLAASCKKKSTPVHCYTCNINDSIVSNIPAFMRDTVKFFSTDTLCDWNQAMANFYVTTHTLTDTLVYRNDTTVYDYKVPYCIMQ